MTRAKNPRAKSSSGGFTLVELTLVLAISSFLLMGVIALAKSWMGQAALTANQQRLTAIQQAIANYETQHNRLPCPASFTEATNSTSFGRESTSCTGALAAGTYMATGRVAGGIGAPGTVPMPPITNNTVIIGALPVRDLGLADYYAADTYNHMYSYAVTESETSTTTSLNNLAGVIDVGDAAGNSILPLAPDGITKGTALYVVVDHGKDGKGAHLENGAAAPATSCGTALNGLDFYNCNYTETVLASIQFRTALYNNKPGSSLWFDDMIIYDTGRSNTNTSSVPQSCTVITATNSTFNSPGANTGHFQSGVDAGPFAGAGAIAFGIFGFVNWFTIYIDPSSDFTHYKAPTADAYCPNATYHVVTGGCTQTIGPGALSANGSVTAPFGGDVAIDALRFNYGTISGAAYHNTNVGIQGYNFQYMLPPQSHPAKLNAAGKQGWECNGSSASGMYTQAYAVCCK